MPSYQSFGTGDIIATFNGRVIAELLSITWSVEREKAPNYVLGRVNPVGYARGRRGIAGELVFAVFNRNALLQELRRGDENDLGKPDVMSYYDFGVSGVEEDFDFLDDEIPFEGGAAEAGLEQWLTARMGTAESRPSVQDVNQALTEALDEDGARNLINAGGRIKEISYVDQIKPFNVTINFLNEAGKAAKLSILDLEIMNEGSGVSIQDLATSQNYTWVARDIHELHAVRPISGTPKRDQDIPQIIQSDMQRT